MNPTVQPRPLFHVGLVAIPLLSLFGCKDPKDSIKESVPVEAPEPFTNDWGQWLSMGVMPDGSPAAASYDRTEGGMVFATATVSGGVPTWTHEKVDGYPDDAGLDAGDRGTYTSMAIGSDGAVWVAYYDLKVRTLRYSNRAPDGTWTSGVGDVGEGATPNAGVFTSIALDGQGRPVIAHHDEEKGRLRVAHWNDSSFSGEVVDEGEALTTDTGTTDADVGEFAKIRIAGGVEYIAYYDRANGALKLAKGTAGSYSIEVVDDSADVGQWPDLLIEDDGTVHIAYQDVDNQDLKYAVGTPGSWTISTVDDGDYVGADGALFMNGSYPAIVYFDGHDNNVKLAQKSGDAWTADTLAGSEGALGYHNEVITTGGVRYAACYDYTHRTVWFSELGS